MLFTEWKGNQIVVQQTKYLHSSIIQKKIIFYKIARFELLLRVIVVKKKKCSRYIETIVKIFGESAFTFLAFCWFAFQCATVIDIFISWTIISFFFFLALPLNAFYYCIYLHRPFGVMYDRYYWKSHTQIWTDKTKGRHVIKSIGAAELLFSFFHFAKKKIISRNRSMMFFCMLWLGLEISWAS